MYPLSACVSFEGLTDGVTLVSRVRLPLPMFCAVRTDDEDDVQFLARAALEAESVVGGYSRPEHDACVASLPNGGRLNRVFELVGVAYGARPVPGRPIPRLREKGKPMLRVLLQCVQSM
jgi:hypothetical protein